MSAVLLALVPVVAISLSPWSAATGLLVLGVLPTLTAAPLGVRAMLTAATGSVATAFVAVLLAQTGGWAPWLGTALVVLLSLATGALVLSGLHPVGAAAISFAAYVLVDPAGVIVFLDARATGLAAAAAVTTLVLLGCGWVIGAVATVLRGVTLPPTDRLPPTLPYGALLAVLCGGFTLVCAYWFHGTNAWWAVMTVAVILQPTHGETGTKLRGRIVGTILGGTLAALIAVILPGELVGILLGVAASLASVMLLLSGAAYWKYSVAVTMSVILLTFERSEVVVGDIQRILVTVAAAAVTAAVVSIATRLAPAQALADPGQRSGGERPPGRSGKLRP